MLSGVDENGLNLWMPLHFPNEWSDFRKIGTGPDDVKDLQELARAFVDSDGEEQYSSRNWTLVLGVADSQTA